jgi:hypothetical protein
MKSANENTQWVLNMVMVILKGRGDKAKDELSEFCKEMLETTGQHSGALIEFEHVCKDRPPGKSPLITVSSFGWVGSYVGTVTMEKESRELIMPDEFSPRDQVFMAAAIKFGYEECARMQKMGELTVDKPINVPIEIIAVSKGNENVH